MNIPKQNAFQKVVCQDPPKYIDQDTSLEVGGEFKLTKPTCFKSLKLSCAAPTTDPVEEEDPAEEDPAEEDTVDKFDPYDHMYPQTFDTIVLLLIFAGAYFFRNSLRKLFNSI
jgi:hypothetical protein